MQLTKLISYTGWFLIILGLALSFYKEDNSSKYTTEIIEEDPYIQGKICLKELLFYEARGVSDIEKEAILDVALNRYRSAKYPDKICKVVKQPMQFSYRIGIEYSKNILPEIQNISSNLDRKAYLIIDTIVENRFNNKEILPNKVLAYNVLWYHLSSINKPYWARSKKIKEVKISVDKKFSHRYYASEVH